MKKRSYVQKKKKNPYAYRVVLGKSVQYYEMHCFHDGLRYRHLQKIDWANGTKN